MDERKNKKIAIIICILLSFALWLYVVNVENPNHEFKIRDVQVGMLNTEALESRGLVFAPDQELKVDLKIEGPSNKV